MRKPWQELGSPAKCLGGCNRGSATEVGLLPLGGEREGGKAPGAVQRAGGWNPSHQPGVESVWSLALLDD